MTMTEELPYLIIAYYHLVPLEDPAGEVKKHRAFLEARDVKARIYFSETGINCQMSALAKDAHEYMAWIKERPEFASAKFKLDPYPTHAFPKLTIKYRKQLVAFDAEVDFSHVGEHVAPKRWKEMLEKDDGHVVLDIRNDYEWEVGRFASADRPPCQTSRGFKEYAKQLKNIIDPVKTPVMMYCTGGIRCELFSALLKADGFEKVYQLDGGVINYGHQQGSEHWEGKLFVFDDRMTAPISNESTPVVGHCHHCGTSNETYYNCANMDCNALFLCCPTCLQEHAGCCKKECTESPHLRPYHHQEAHKPFRKWYTYFKEKR
jgi:UPF0176 protein